MIEAQDDRRSALIEELRAHMLREYDFEMSDDWLAGVADTVLTALDGASQQPR